MPTSFPSLQRSSLLCTSKALSLCCNGLQKPFGPWCKATLGNTWPVLDGNSLSECADDFTEWAKQGLPCSLRYRTAAFQLTAQHLSLRPSGFGFPSMTQTWQKRQRHPTHAFWVSLTTFGILGSSQTWNTSSWHDRQVASRHSRSGSAGLTLSHSCFERGSMVLADNRLLPPLRCVVPHWVTVYTTKLTFGKEQTSEGELRVMLAHSHNVRTQRLQQMNREF